MLRLVLTSLAAGATVLMASSGVQVGRSGHICGVFGPCLDPLALGLAAFIGFMGWATWRHISPETTLSRLWAEKRGRLIGAAVLIVVLALILLMQLDTVSQHRTRGWG